MYVGKRPNQGFSPEAVPAFFLWTESQNMSQPPRFGLMTLTCVVIASMIGSGVFTTSGYSIASLGTPARVLLAWLVGGVIAICGAVSYGELSRRLPVSGGEYLYLSRRLHPYFGFLAGWVSLTAGFSGAIAMAAITFETYAVAGVGLDWLPEHLAAAAVILIFGVGHAFVERATAGVQNAVVLVKLAVLGVFLLVAASKLGTHEWFWAGATAGGAGTGTWAEIQLFASSVMWISLSFAGFNAGIYIASEVRDAERVVPRSLLIGTLMVTVIYLLLNAVFLTAVPVEQIRMKGAIAAIAAAGLGGAPLEGLIRLAVSLGTLSSVAGMVMTGPRVFSRMADDGLFPAYFRSGPYSTSRTVLLQTVIAVFLVYATDFRALLNYLSAVLALSSALTVSTLFIPERLAKGEHKQSECRAISIWTGSAAFLYVAATLITASLMALNDPGNLKGAFWTIVSGTCLWAVAARWGRVQREFVP